MRQRRLGKESASAASRRTVVSHAARGSSGNSLPATPRPRGPASLALVEAAALSASAAAVTFTSCQATRNRAKARMLAIWGMGGPGARGPGTAVPGIVMLLLAQATVVALTGAAPAPDMVSRSTSWGPRRPCADIN
jgi:hypothetical protein